MVVRGLGATIGVGSQPFCDKRFGPGPENPHVSQERAERGGPAVVVEGDPQVRQQRADRGTTSYRVARWAGGGARPTQERQCGGTRGIENSFGWGERAVLKQ